ncbi:MAG TPA: zinc-ribbon domain-containing protein [Pyrinomonadaceae bacterium]|jgi:predicted Zn finger-like uncharacterized protein|nr:zinc-ribbon domain-containing protein [Pyrinomonadaceae bacterium]
MVIICQQCSARLQLDDAKVPARSFTVRCPKCQQIINAQPPAQAPDYSALGVGDVAQPTQSRFGKPMPAPAFKPEANTEEPGADAAISSNKTEVTRLLSSLLQQAMATAATEASQTTGSRGWGHHRRALVCAAPEHRYAVARILVENGYEVFVAEDTTQAIERMREDQMDVILLAPDFDPGEQGAAFVSRELSALRPGVRRRTFLVHMMPDVRTGDQHAALVRSANFVLNPADMEDLPRALDRVIRDFNELYRNYNQALQLQGI